MDVFVDERGAQRDEKCVVLSVCGVNTEKTQPDTHSVAQRRESSDFSESCTSVHISSPFTVY